MSRSVTHNNREYDFDKNRESIPLNSIKINSSPSDVSSIIKTHVSQSYSVHLT